MTIDPIQFLVGVIVTGVSVIVLALLVRIIATVRGKTGNPTVAAVLDALKPYIYTAILAAERTADGMFTTASVTLEGTDKAKVANSIYDTLPDTIVVGSVTIPISLVKLIVSREVFAAAVKSAYGAADAFILRNKAYFDKQVVGLIPASRTASAPTHGPLAQ